MKRLIQRLITSRAVNAFLAPPFYTILYVCSYAVSTKNGALASWGLCNPDKPARPNALSSAILGSRNADAWNPRDYQIYCSIGATKKIRGEIAHVTAFSGGLRLVSSVFSESKTEKKMCCFEIRGFARDSGQAGSQDHDNVVADEKAWSTDKIYVHRGIFPEIAAVANNQTFSCVHLDVGTYEEARNCLDLFYPIVSLGGMIVCENYPKVEGVWKAVDEFFKDKDEPVIELPFAQCLIVKI